MKWLILLLSGVAIAQDAGFDRLVDRFVDEYFLPSNPSSATGAGFHQFDSRLEDYSRKGVDGRVKALRSFEAGFAGQAASPDREIVLSYIRGQLLELETIRGWERNPDRYSGGIASSTFGIMSRKFAPADSRLRSLIARELLMPQALREARVNLKNPPRIFTEVALQQIPGIVGFFRTDVPAAFNAVTDRKLLADFKIANDKVIQALREYETFLRTDVLRRSNGDFRIGADTYRKKLLFDEMVDIPLDRLLKIGYDDLHANQEAFRRTAARIDASKTPAEVLAVVEKEHPPAAQLLQTFRDSLGGLREFIAARKIVTIPSPVLPILEETRPFMRALTSASMDTPGPYEKVAKEAYFNVTLPEAKWDAKQTEEFMTSLSRGVILSTAIHEAYPGHYTQFLWMQRVPSKVRKLFGAGSNAEGWAHYCEQMMLDEGFSQDPKMKLGQLRDALLRNARYIAGIQMHTGNMTREQAEEFFVKEGYQARPTAVQESKRGTSDPTYLVYTLGKLQIMKLREDYRKLRGSQFSLLEFHDRFMRQGFPPIKIVRRAMLGDDSPTL